MQSFPLSYWTVWAQLHKHYEVCHLSSGVCKSLEINKKKFGLKYSKTKEWLEIGRNVVLQRRFKVFKSIVKLSKVLLAINFFRRFFSCLSAGKGYLHRKAARSLRQEHWLTKNDDGTYTFNFSSPLTSSEVTFTSGEEFEETKPDGVKV